MIISILDTIKNGDISGGAIGWIAFFIITICFPTPDGPVSILFY